MAALIAFYSRAGENYFGGAYRRISVGNTEKVAEMLADLTGGELYKIEQAEPYSDDYKTCVAQAHNLAVVSIDRRYRGQAHKVAQGLWGAGQMMFNKYLVITGEDCDVHDPVRLLPEKPPSASG